MEHFALGFVVGFFLAHATVAIVLLIILVTKGNDSRSVYVLAAPREESPKTCEAPTLPTTAPPGKHSEDTAGATHRAPETPPCCSACAAKHDMSTALLVDLGTSKVVRVACPACGHVDDLPDKPAHQL